MEGRCPNPNTLDALFHVECNTTPGEHMESRRVRPCRRLSGIRSVEETVGMEEEEAEVMLYGEGRRDRAGPPKQLCRRPSSKFTVSRAVDHASRVSEIER